MFRAGCSSVISGALVAFLFLSSAFISPCRSNGVLELLENGTIVTALENVNLEELTFKKRHINQSVPATLKFRINSLPTPTWSFKWLLDGHELKVTRYTNTLPSKPGNIYTTELESNGSVNLTLHLQDKGLIPGNYTVVFSDVSGSTPEASQSGFVNAPPILPLFSKDRRVLEGDRLSLFCEVTGYPKPNQVHWFFAHIQPDMMEDKSALAEARDRLEELVLNANVSKFITNSVTNDQLLFVELPSDYNGLYKCKVDGDDGGDETLILVNVKDRWAALWPFVGIVIEVTVLVTAILLYERHQMRSKPTKTDVVTGQATADAASPNVKRTGAAQVQQNNTTVPVTTPDPNVDVNVEGNRSTGVEFGDAKHDELRQRGASRC